MYMQSHAPAQQQANAAPRVLSMSEILSMSDEEFNRFIARYYNYAREVAQAMGVNQNLIPNNIPVEIRAQDLADFFDQKDAFERGQRAFTEIQQSWHNYILEPTRPNPLQLAMGGSLFAASIDDEIKIDIKELDPSVVQNFINQAQQLGAKTEVDENGKLVMRREDLIQAVVIYRLLHPSCTKKDAELYNSIAKGIQEKDKSINNKNRTFGSITSVLSVGSMSLAALAFFNPAIMACPPVMFGLLAIQVVTLIPRIISLCRSLIKMNYNDDAERISKGITTLNKAVQMVINDAEKKTKRGFAYGMKYLQKVKTKPGFSEHAIGIITTQVNGGSKTSVILNEQQQKEINDHYNYPIKNINHNKPRYNLNDRSLSLVRS